MIAAIFAVDEAGSIGFQGSMPWPQNVDSIQWFKKTTQNQVVVIGKRTWESADLPHPLPGRETVLFTNNFIERDDIEQVRGDVCEALTSLKRNNKKFDIYVYGGADVIMQSRPVLEKIFISRIPGVYLHDCNINLTNFLNGFVLADKINLGSCVVEEYHSTKVQAKRTPRIKSTPKDL